MDSPDQAPRLGHVARVPDPRRDVLFGQVMSRPMPQNNLDAYYCDSPGADQNVVPRPSRGQPELLLLLPQRTGRRQPA